MDLYDLLHAVDGPTLVELATSRTGGSRTYHVVEEPHELAQLVEHAPASARFLLLPLGPHLPYEATYYKPPGPGSY